MHIYGPWRSVVVRAVMILAVTGLLAAQAIAIQRTWNPNTHNGGVWGFLKSGYRIGYTLGCRVWVVTEPGAEQRILKKNPLRDSDVLSSSARVVVVDGLFRGSEYGRLRRTTTDLTATVKTEVLRPGVTADGRTGPADVTGQERDASRPLLVQHASGRINTDLGTFTGMVFARYDERPEPVYHWRAIATTAGQVLLVIVTLGVLGWLLATVSRDIRRANRLQRGLCPACRYPVPTVGGCCPECGPGPSHQGCSAAG